jgi:aminoglycoside phosphotransferase (APT) family kinase protein
MLVKDGLVTAILDWSGFIVGDPMAGLGWTIAILIASGKHRIRKELFEEAIQMYKAEYEKVGHIDHHKLNYFIVFRLAMALLEGLDGQEYWTKPEIVNTIVNELKEMTGISVKLARTEF